MRLTRLLVLTALAAAGSAPATLLAQTERSGSGASAQLAMQMQQLAAERGRLQAENTTLKADKESLRKELDAAKTGQTALVQSSRSSQAELATARRELERVEADLVQQKARLGELTGKYRDLAASLRDVEAQKDVATRGKLAGEEELRVCVQHNQGLYAISTEVLGRMEKQGIWSAIARSESFTRLKRTELENLADGYREAASSLHLSESSAPQGGR